MQKRIDWVEEQIFSNDIDPVVRDILFELLNMVSVLDDYKDEILRRIK